MENFILLSWLNDFIFCPRSIYFHQLCENVDTTLYQEKAQVEGKLVHAIIDEKKFSSLKNVLQGMEIYSEKFNLIGKIDVYDSIQKKLCERKKKIHQIYDGHILQLYGQYYCMREMGFDVKKLVIHSLDDNKNYYITLPEEDEKMRLLFEQTIKDIKKFRLEDMKSQNINKCKSCIYQTLCDIGYVE